MDSFFCMVESIALIMPMLHFESSCKNVCKAAKYLPLVFILFQVANAMFVDAKRTS